MEWTVVGKISTGITLLAFIAALIAAAYRASIKGKINTLKALRPEDRLAAVTQTLNTFGINSADFTRDNAFQIALDELSIKDRKYKLIAAVVVVLALIFAIVAAYVIYETGQKRADFTGASVPGQSSIVQPIEYKNSAKNAEDILTSFKLPKKMSNGLCSDMFARGNLLRASIPTLDQIQDHLDNLTDDKSDVEKHNAREFLNQIFDIEKRAKAWKQDASATGCFEPR